MNVACYDWCHVAKQNYENKQWKGASTACYALWASEGCNSCNHVKEVQDVYHTRVLIIWTIKKLFAILRRILISTLTTNLVLAGLLA